MSNIFEIVENNGAVIYADSELGFFITWNTSATFQWFIAANDKQTEFVATDIRTVYAVDTIENAEAVAKRWVAEALAEIEN